MDALDRFIEEILDIARENPLSDAQIIIRDRLLKDVHRVIDEAYPNDPLVRFSFRTTQRNSAGRGDSNVNQPSQASEPKQ